MDVSTNNYRKDMRYSPKGSTWRVWDFHIHSPASFQWSGAKLYGLSAEQKEEQLRLMVNALECAEAEVFVVQDYWTFDGYHALREYLHKHPEIEFTKTVLPGMELRIQSPTRYRLNVHGIFSEELSKQQLDDFKSKLLLAVTDRSLSYEAIADYAQNHTDDAVRRTHGAQNLDLTDGDIAYGFGAKIIEIKKDSFVSAFNSLPHECGVVMMPWDTSDGLARLDHREHFASAREYFSFPHIFETRKEFYREAFIGVKSEANEGFFDDFSNALNGIPRLAVAGSDAHAFANYAAFPGNRITWLKAEPCFKGLMQAIREPISRSFIGQKPEKLKWLESHPTELIDGISVRRIDGATTSDAWFDGTSIDLNADLVAIIGNKGSGKSALADIVALTGGSGVSEYFSFLTGKRFRDPKMAWSREFSATIKWLSGEENSTLLSDNPEQSSVERVKYISQKYFEELCSSDGQEGASRFEKELKSVIFSHVDSSDKQDYASLDALLFDRESSLRSAISSSRASLTDINLQIIEAENSFSTDRLKRIKERIAHKESELSSHGTIKPESINPPEETQTEEQKETVETLKGFRERVKELELKNTNNALEKSNLVSKRNSFETIIQSVSSLVKTVAGARDSISDHLEKTGVNWDDIVSFKVDDRGLTDAVSSINDGISSISLNDSENAEEIAAIEVKIKQLDQELDQPNKEYQAYLGALKEWEDQQKDIVGSSDQSGSLKFYQAQLEAYGKLPERIQLLLEKREAQVRDIFGYLEKIQQLQRSMYKPVQHLIESHRLVKDEFELTFETSNSVTSLRQTFFNYIKRSSGTFSGEVEGFEQLDQLINISDFESADGAMEFLNTLLNMLKYDRRTGSISQDLINIEDKLLKSDQKLISFYDYIFGLNFLESRYSLLLQGVPVDKLSPGQRGALLLIFYLLVDKETRPIVLDQPEENLDNQTVYSLLVPVIKEAKDRRQVIMVTHNANLAVTCDAEQIIHATFDRNDSNKMSYVSGAIENPAINSVVLDILEGTEPAFMNRNSKYMIRS